MKNLILFIAVLFIAISCKSNDKQDSKISTSKSTSKTIEYDLSKEIASTEGAGAKAIYIDGKIKKCTINIYSEMGQTEIIYLFKNDQIEVTQENQTYSTEGDSIDTQKSTSKKISYVIDLNGLLLSSDRDQEDIVDVFEEVKKSIRFELK